MWGSNEMEPLPAITRLASMRGRTRIALLAGVLAIVIGGCGSGDDGTIPMDQSTTLLNLLAAVQANVEDGDCELAAKNALELTRTVSNLPDDVDRDLRSELTKASVNLTDLAQEPEQCTESGASGPTGTETSESTTTSTATTATEPDASTTTTDEPDTTDQPTEDPNPEPDAGNGQGQGAPGTQGTEGAGGQGGGGTSSGGTTAGGGGG